MGNLIKDFWTYENYYGITEVIGGSLEYRKTENKYETRIEKALEYMLKPGLRLLSHMSVQTYNEYLNKKGRELREEKEKSYYPFLVELETKVKPDAAAEDEFKRQYKEMLYESYLLVTYLIYCMGMEEKDILIMLNNSRSVYILINPVSYELVPSNKNHLIYKEMFKLLSEEVSLSYADMGMYKHCGLMKTPNTYYNGGYFVPISYEELKSLRDNISLKKELTGCKRSLDYEVSGNVCDGMSHLYQKARDNVYSGSVESIRKDKVSGFEVKERSCVKYIRENEIEDGKKNFALVSVAYNLKEQGYSKEDANKVLNDISDSWQYESHRRMEAKIKSIYKGNKKFSCDKARDCLGIEDICRTCPSNFKNKEFVSSRFKVHKKIIDDLWSNNAGLRHNKAYLELSRKGLFNVWFSIETTNLNIRTLKELCKLSGELIFDQKGDSIFIYNKLKDSNDQYILILNYFMDDKTYEMLKEHLKHFLKIVFTGYKIGKEGKYVLTNVKKEKIMEILGYESYSGMYKFMQKLEDVGLAIYKKGKLCAIYFESYKVIDIRSKKSKEFFENGKIIGGKQSYIFESNYSETPNTG